MAGMMLVGFVLGVVCSHSLLNSDSAFAAQTFRQGEVKSVPSSFLQGGDRNLAVLKEILGEIKNNGASIREVTSAAKEVSQSVKEMSGKLDSTTHFLRRLDYGGDSGTALSSKE